MSAAAEHEREALARAALAEVTDPADVGPLVAVDEPVAGVVDLRFASLLPGYADWTWTVSTAAVGDDGPTVLEVELLPGDGALLAPPWVPWAERLAEWRRSHAEGDEHDDDDDDEDDDLDDESDDDGGDTDEDDELDEDDLGGDVLDQGVDVEDAVGADDSDEDDEEPGDEDDDRSDDEEDDSDEDERDEGLREP